MSGISAAYLVLGLLSVAIAFLYYKLFYKSFTKYAMLAFISVCGVELSYFSLSVSKSLQLALFFNRSAYFFSVLLINAMLIIVLELCHIRMNRAVYVIIAGFAFFATALAWSGGTGIRLYYETVSLNIVNGTSVLEKTYGVMHIWYSVYIIVLFAAVLSINIYTAFIKRMAVNINPIVMCILVLQNVFIWVSERFAVTNFELISGSYVMSELSFLLLFENIVEYDRFNRIIDDAMKKSRTKSIAEISGDWVKEYGLTQREEEILVLLLENYRRTDIADNLCITESTVKKHTSHIYEKIGIESRSDLLRKMNEEMSEK